MAEIRFEWDKNKDRINVRKHGISFQEAASVFYDKNAIVFDDPDHSYDEERFLILGVSLTQKICIVSHCYREDDEVIRIISARRATKNESRFYTERL